MNSETKTVPVPAATEEVGGTGGETKRLTKKERKQARARKFDMSAQYQRYVALRVAYLGENYEGFAMQNPEDNTIEGNLHRAFRKVCLVDPNELDPKGYDYTRCGRTDRGVSSFGQVVSLRLRSKLKSGKGIIPPAQSTAAVSNTDEMPDDDNELDYCAALNSVLPKDIRVTGWTGVEPTFNARFDCTYRHYKYFFMGCGIGMDTGILDIEVMKKAASYFVGEHDFRNFCYIDLVNVESFVRTIHEVYIEPVGTSSPMASMYCLNVKGSGFLWHQVRCMVAILFAVGRHEEEPDVIPKLLDIKAYPGKPPYVIADEKPLVLYDCGFEPALKFRTSSSALSGVWNAYTRMWSEACIRSTMISVILGDLTKYPVDNGTSLLLPERDKKRKAFEATHKRKSILESKDFVTLEQRLAEMGPTKKRKYDAKQQKRKFFQESMANNSNNNEEEEEEGKENE